MTFSQLKILFFKKKYIIKVLEDIFTYITSKFNVIKFIFVGAGGFFIKDLENPDSRKTMIIFQLKNKNLEKTTLIKVLEET